MALPTTTGTQTQSDTPQIDSWAAAFEFLNKQNEDDAKNGDQSGDTSNNANISTNDANQSTSPDTDGTGYEASLATDDGGLDSVSGGSGEETGTDSGSTDELDITAEDIESYRASILEDVRQGIIGDLNDQFIKRGILNHDGIVGATIDNPAICKRDDDGVPHFYNPETGREFSGENPRRQAQEWVDDYNKELETVFNRMAKQREDEAMKQREPELAVLEFEPKYNAMDPVRQALFDNLIEQYEIKDSAGDVVGYTCNLDDAAAAIERMVATLQTFAPVKPVEEQAAASAPTGPALDMPNGSGSSPDAQPKSLEEALKMIQDRQLNGGK